MKKIKIRIYKGADITDLLKVVNIPEDVMFIEKGNGVYEITKIKKNLSGAVHSPMSSYSTLIDLKKLGKVKSSLLIKKGTI